MKELMVALMTWAAPVVGLPMPSDLPTLKYAAHCDLQALAYDGTSKAGSPCEEDGPQAVYLSEADTIYLPDDWSPKSPYKVAMLVHELVHFMQDRDGLFDDRTKIKCHASEVEKPAYHAHLKWLEASYGSREAALKVSEINELYLMLTTECTDDREYAR